MIPTKKARALKLGLALLTLVNLVNYLDRYVISSLVEAIKHSELSPTDAQLGWLMTGFILVYMVASPVFGALGDRLSRPKLLAIGVAIWSLATALGGFARSFATLFAARSAVGIGEAAFGTISPGLLADYFPKSTRGRVFAIFYAAIPVGSALGFVLGGLVEQAWSWRAAFFVAAIPGLILAGFCLRLFDPPRGGLDDLKQPDQPHLPSASSIKNLLSTYAGLLYNRKYISTVLGLAAYTFAMGGLAFWMPAFLERVRGIPRETATIQFGAIVVATGFIGTFAGGWLGDRLLLRWRQAYLLVSAIATLLAAPLTALALISPDKRIFYPALVVGEILLFVSTGPINSVIVDSVRATERATAVAFHIFLIHILGDVPSPPLIGAISDAIRNEAALAKAMLLVPLAIGVAGLTWLIAAWREGVAGIGELKPDRRQDAPELGPSS